MDNRNLSTGPGGTCLTSRDCSCFWRQATRHRPMKGLLSIVFESYFRAISNTDKVMSDPFTTFMFVAHKKP